MSAATSETPDQAYGRLREGVHVAGYSFERACTSLEWLLQEGRWRTVGNGFETINEFMASIYLGDLRVVAEQRKRLAKMIKEAQPEASNRAIAKMVGAASATIDRDTASNEAPSKKKAKGNNEPDLKGASNEAPTAFPKLDGARAARMVGRRTNAKEDRLARVAADEQRVLQLQPIPGKFRTLILDPAWDYDWLSLAGRAKPGYAMQTHQQLLALDVRAWADEKTGTHLYLWATNNFLARACELVTRWGFQHRTVITWVKPPPFGLGSYFRNSSEQCLFATLGDTTTRHAAASIPTHFEAPRGQHSEKPEKFYEIVRAASYPPFGEGNQREPREDFANLFCPVTEAPEGYAPPATEAAE